MFNDFLIELNAGTSAVASIIGSYFGAMSCGSMIAGALFKRFSMRFVGLFGAFLYSLGSIIVVFVHSVEMLTISFGILQGIFTKMTKFSHLFLSTNT